MTTVLAFETSKRVNQEWVAQVPPSVGIKSQAVTILTANEIPHYQGTDATIAPNPWIEDNISLLSPNARVIAGFGARFQKEWDAEITQKAPDEERRKKLEQIGAQFGDLQTSVGAEKVATESRTAAGTIGEWRWTDMVGGAGKLTPFGDQVFSEYLTRFSTAAGDSLTRDEFHHAYLLFERLAAALITAGMDVRGIRAAVRHADIHEVPHDFAADVSRHPAAPRATSTRG